MPLEILRPPTVSRERLLNYKICPLFLYSICYSELCIYFSVRMGENFLLVGFSKGITLDG